MGSRSARRRSDMFAGSIGLVLSVVLCFNNVAEVEGGAGRNIEETASYRVAIFFVVFLVLSLLLEQFFHQLEHCLHHIGQVGLEEAVHKIKEELMLMGFISLMLIALEEKIIRICVEPSVDPEGIYCCSVQAPNKTDFELRADACCGLGAGSALDSYYDYAYYSGGRRQLAVSECEVTDEYVACMNATVTEWEELGGYIPGSDSNLLDVCPAPGQTTHHLPSGAHAFECLDTWTDENGVEHAFASFMDPTALHNLHTLIFLTALFHIVYSAVIMLLSQCCVKKWAEWETYGDDEGETIDKLVPPAKWGSRFLQCLVNFVQQFYKNVDPLAYLVIRRYYIIRNQLPSNFDFNIQLREAHRNDFKDLVGVTWWMWFVVIIQTLLDGYISSVYPFAKMLNTYLALFICFTVGTKLMFVYRDLVVQTLHSTRGLKDISKDFRHKSLTVEQLDELQSDTIRDYSVYDHIEADFWFQSCLKEKSPKVILAMIRLVMFQNSLVLAQFIFYLWQIDSEACFFIGRTQGGKDYTILVLQVVVLFFMMFLNGFVTVPLYSLCAITLHHDIHDELTKKKYSAVKKARKNDKMLMRAATLAEMLTPSKIVKKFDEFNMTELKMIADNVQKELAARSELSSNDVTDVEAIEDAPTSSTTTSTTEQTDSIDSKTSGDTVLAVKHGLGTKTSSTHSGRMAVDVALRAFSGRPAAPASERIDFSASGANSFILQAKAKVLDKKIAALEQRREAFMRVCAQRRAHDAAVARLSPSQTNKKSAWGEGGAASKAKGHGTVKVHPLDGLQRSSTFVDTIEHEESIAEVAKKNPRVIVITFGILMVLALIILLVSSMQSWLPTYGYYVPHWAYDGFGAPYYWADLTQDSNEMALYNEHHGITDYSVCASGTSQSPIDIEINAGEGIGYKNASSTYALGDILDLKPAYFYQYQSHEVPLFKCSTGKYGCGSLVWQNVQYNLYKMKFHVPAEHRLDGLQANAELQLYFCDGDCDEEKDNWAAVAILLVVGSPDGVSESPSINELHKLLADPGFDQDILDDYSQMETLPEKTYLGNITSLGSAFYRYSGSMTIPPCYENIKWFVMADLASIAYDDWFALWTHVGFPGNARPPPATYKTVPFLYHPDNAAGVNPLPAASDLLHPHQEYTGSGPSA